MGREAAFKLRRSDIAPPCAIMSPRRVARSGLVWGRVMVKLVAGDSVEDLLEAFPSLRREQVLACFDHAARLMGNQYSLGSAPCADAISPRG